MNRKSRYNIKIDFRNSNGSFIFDKNSKKKYLDFFGQYAHLLSATTMKFSNLKSILKQLTIFLIKKQLIMKLLQMKLQTLTNHLKSIHHLISLTIITMLVLEHQLLRQQLRQLQTIKKIRHSKLFLLREVFMVLTDMEEL